MNTNRPRPTSLSDPHHDFTPESLRALLAVSDEEMTMVHYRHLLGPFLPAGTYEESVYFLPLAFDYMGSHPEDAADMTLPIFGFASKHASALAADGLLPSTRRRIAESLENLAGHFIITHLDRAQCMAKGLRREYADYVVNSSAIVSAVQQLVGLTANQDLAEQFIAGLARHENDPTKAAWFLEYATNPPPDNDSIKAILKDYDLYEAAADVVREDLRKCESVPTYWMDTFEVLGMQLAPE